MTKKQVGNATRTKSQIRHSKSRGAQFEYDVLYNLQKMFPNMYLTSKQGFQQQLDLLDDTAEIAVECKFLKTMSWNQAKKFFLKLESVAPKEGYDCMLVYKTNQQPVLIMVRELKSNAIIVSEFEDGFGKFEKHPSTRVKK